MSGIDLLLAAAIVAAASTVQGTLGFGQALISAPLLLLVDPRLVPGPAVLGGLALNLLMLTRDHGHADHAGLPWAVAGVVPGTVAAGVALTVLPDDTIAVVSAVLILVAVALSGAGLHPRRTKPVLAGAGVASGFMGTAASVGGPPLALLYQREGGPALRATLSRFFTASAGFSLVALVVAGRLDSTSLLPAAAMAGGVVVGFAASGPLRHRVHAGHARTGVLVISGVSGVAALLKALL